MNFEESFVHRDDTVTITIKEIMQEFFAPELLLLQLSPKARRKPLDIGSLAYFRVGRNDSIHDVRSTPVSVSSFVEGRRKLIDGLLGVFWGKSEKTIVQTFTRVQRFVSWLNVEGYREIFPSEVIAQEAYREYTAHLNHRIYMGELKPRSASHYQDGAISVIEILYPESYRYIVSGAVRIVAEKDAVAPSEAHVQLYKDVCLAIAKQCSEFVLGFNAYPCVVTVRDYEVVLFPSNVGAVGPFEKGAPVYNAAERRISTAEEYFDACVELGRKDISRSNISKTIRDAAANLAGANQNERCRHRRALAAHAMKAYAYLFIMITGASPTEFSQFTYSNALEVEKSPLKKELSAVKFRAGGKATLYGLGRVNGLPLLREYLKLREWILNGEPCDKLFFSVSDLGGSRGGEGSRFGIFSATYAMQSFHKFISGVFVDLDVPVLTSRSIRKYKSITLHSGGVPLSVVSSVLNHSEGMNLSAYSEGSADRQEEEFNAFWQSLRHAAAIFRERINSSSGNLISTAAGHCDDFNKPTLLDGGGVPVFEPSCRTQYGCLYCQHYVCHADEEDLHKLTSLQYVVDAVRKSAPDTAHAEVLYKDLFIRIEFVLDAIGEHSESAKRLVDDVRKRVFEYGVLTPFWELRLERYEALGVVF